MGSEPCHNFTARVQVQLDDGSVSSGAHPWASPAEYGHHPAHSVTVMDRGWRLCATTFEVKVAGCYDWGLREPGMGAFRSRLSESSHRSGGYGIDSFALPLDYASCRENSKVLC